MSPSSNSKAGAKKQPQRALQPKHTASSPPPRPFAPAPATLAPFLAILDKSKVYITHIDTQPRGFKTQVFAVPVLLNLAITALLAWRAYYAIPTYYLYILTILGNQTTQTVDADALTSMQLLGVILRRTAMIAFDYVLATIILPWPFGFFLDFPGNPVTWRWQVGFKDAEIVVRESRGWGADDLVTGNRKGADSPFWANRIAPAVEMQYIRGKTGYVMMGKDWDLDFERMIWAEEFVKNDGLGLGVFRTKVLVYMDGPGWLSWTADWEDDDSDDSNELEARTKIQQFHERLTRVGKESLFFRWIELIQYQTNSQGGISRESLLGQAREMFGEQGIDFDAFANSLGGVEALPGISEARKA